LTALFNAMIRRRLTAGALLWLAGCGGSNNGGPGPTPVAEAPQIACPTDITVKSVAGTSQAVTYPDPTVTKGVAPVTTNCNRSSGSTFPLGTTSVSCTATDAQQRASTCSFNVTLSGFTMSVKTFEAFGDSLTAGETGRANFVDSANSYPTRLQQSLDASYPGQGMTVINRGLNGDSVEATVAKIRQYVPGDKPDGVLVLSGYNNLTQPCPRGASGSQACRDAIDNVAVGILDCIRKARESSSSVKYVFVSTLTPPGPTGSQRIDANAIVQANNRIKQIIAQERATLADSYVSFLGHEAEYVNVDGLHLKPEGYQALADTFFAAIQATVPQSPLFRVR
jgi:lysophospholipase L1-like esterase